MAKTVRLKPLQVRDSGRIVTSKGKVIDKKKTKKPEKEEPVFKITGRRIRSDNQVKEVHPNDLNRL